MRYSLILMVQTPQSVFQERAGVAVTRVGDMYASAFGWKICAGKTGTQNDEEPTMPSALPNTRSDIKSLFKKTSAVVLLIDNPSFWD